MIPYQFLFVLAVEFLPEAVRTNTKTRVLSFFKREHKIPQYTDNTTLFYNRRKTTLEIIWLPLKSFM